MVRNFVKKVVVWCLILVLGILPVGTVQAAEGSVVSDELIRKYNNYQIYFYNPQQTEGEDDDERDCNGGVSIGDNQNYAGAKVWSDAEIATIKANQSIYEKGVSGYGFPWQVMAVLHSMEHGLQKSNPGNGQGIYQLYSYTNGGTNENAFLPAGPVDDDEFLRQTKIAAGIAVSMAGDLNNPDNVKKLFFKYNGASQKYVEKAITMGFSREQANNGEGSPYVMNRYDARRDPTSSEMDIHWPGRYVKDGVYDPNSTTTVFGAFVKYEALKGSTGGGGGYCDDSGAIVDTALLLSWPGHKSHAKDDPKPEYIKAMEQVGIYHEICNGEGACAPAGASCDVFVGTVMRYSGVDSNFPLTGPTNQQSYMESNSNRYSKAEVSDVSDLQPGDILVKSGNSRHIYLYLGEVEGEQQVQASASFNERTAEHYSGVDLSGYSVFRMINS